METEQIIKLIDFWQRSTKQGDLFEREIVKEIDLKSQEIVDLVGSRRSGKSSVLKLLIRHLGLGDSFLFLNFEDPFFIEHNKPQVVEEILEVYQAHFEPNLKYLFFDEVQALTDWQKVVRKLRDTGNYKIFLTGSSAKLLSREVSSLLTGRHLSYSIWPLSFKEFLSFNQVKIESLRDLVVENKKIAKMFGEYLEKGGFPEVVITKNLELLKNYFFDILQRDIVMRYAVRDKNALEKIAVYLLSNTGNAVSLRALKNTFGLSFVATSNYLEYLKEGFLVAEVPQFAYSLKRQQKAFKKIYALDTGLGNAVSFKFSENKGRMLENVVFQELKRQNQEIYYYKTKNNSEVDFLVKEKTKVKILIQVAWSLNEAKTREREIKSLIVAMDELGLKQGLILTNDEEDEVKLEKKIITVKPVYKWLLE